TFRRQRLELPEGDFLDVDFADIAGHTWADMGDDAPIALILHGLEGSARRPYACAMYRDLAAQGIRSIGLNFRSCSGEINRLPRAYHAGETQDVHFVHQWLAKAFPHVPKMMVGFSLGANILLKYLDDGLYPLASTLKAAVAVSPPFDLAK